MSRRPCPCPQCVAERAQAAQRRKELADEKVLDLVQRQSVTLADLYRRGRAKGLLRGTRGY